MLRPSITSSSSVPKEPSAGIGSWVEVWDWHKAARSNCEYDPRNAHSHAQLDTSARGGQLVQVVPAGIWQSARSHGEFSLANCSVSPGFVWSGLELLDPASTTASELRAAGGLAG